ncbi:DNA polymerase III subunit delta [Changpingibacter yushuensis]|uniref:DNA polymerase III subunit delta n=1 Tax=Changpingibacter yushuensis TaxID=2758440 RepID=UPI0015F4502D|nr:DNA polymerase III subunit delta [Changpingibacter yushuensis]
MMPARAKKNPGLRWDQVELAPVILVVDAEEVLGDWAVQRLVELAMERDPGTEVTKLSASSYTAGHIANLASPSLFGEARFVLVKDGKNMNDAFLRDALEYIKAPEPDVVFVLRHSGGSRGKRLLDAIQSAGFQKAEIPALKYDSEKADLVKSIAARRRRRIGEGAVHDLVDALGNDVRSLVSAVNQLLDDVEGTVDEGAVHRYYSGRNEATGFAVADAAIAGQVGRAIALSRHAIATGSSPVAIVYALALKLRGMNLTLAARHRGSEAETGLAPWQLKRAQSDLRSWSGEGLALALLAVADADFEVKGGSRDPAFALERAIARIGSARSVPSKI